MKLTLIVLVLLLTVAGIAVLCSHNASATIEYRGNTIYVINGTVASPIRTSDIYNASVAGGWNVVKKLGWSVYLFEKPVWIGHPKWGTNYSDWEVTLILNETVPTGASYRFFTLANHSITTFGKVVDYNKKITSKGCTLMSLNQTWAYVKFFATNFPWIHDYNATLNLYSCTLMKRYGKNSLYNNFGMIQNIFQGNIWNCKLIDCQFASLDSTLTTDINKKVNIYSCDSTNVSYTAFSNVGCIMNNVFVTSNIYLEGSASLIFNITNCTFIGYKDTASNWFSITFSSRLTDAYATDCYIDRWDDIYWNGANPMKFWRKYTLALNVTNITGIPISGATVTIYNRSGNVVVTRTTGTNGQISRTILNFGYYDKVHNPGVGSVTTPVQHNPHTIVISKTGYATYTCKFNITSKTNWTIALNASSAATSISGSSDDGTYLIGAGLILGIMFGPIIYKQRRKKKV
jgi:hypothetical protein